MIRPTPSEATARARRKPPPAMSSSMMPSPPADPAVGPATGQGFQISNRRKSRKASGVGAEVERRRQQRKPLPGDLVDNDLAGSLTSLALATAATAHQPTRKTSPTATARPRCPRESGSPRRRVGRQEIPRFPACSRQQPRAKPGREQQPPDAMAAGRGEGARRAWVRAAGARWRRLARRCLRRGR